MNQVVPVIDISPFLNGTGKQEIARQVADACGTVGFLVISGHGVSTETIDNLVSAARNFFALPSDIKKLSVSPPGSKVHRGYTALASRSLAKSTGAKTPPDLREGFTINRVQPKDDTYFKNPAAAHFFADNVWPAEDVAPGFRDALTTYYLEMDRVATSLMRIFALALDMPEHFFDDKVDRHFSNFTSYHYPPLDAPPEPGQLRGGAHTDFGSLTILHGAPSTQGLQVWNQGAWHDVPVVKDAFIVNIGDLMAQWTNDRWVSTLHRVVNPPSVEGSQSRYSFAFFHQPNYDVLIENIDQHAEAKYSPVTSGDHLYRKLSAMRVAESERAS
jgi:isopenicillin N synthase-like dioxygenase